jgi:hypothetical protein
MIQIEMFTEGQIGQFRAQVKKMSLSGRTFGVQLDGARCEDIFGLCCTPPPLLVAICQKAERFRSMKRVTVLPESHNVTEQLFGFMLTYLLRFQEIGKEDIGRYEGT